MEWQLRPALQSLEFDVSNGSRQPEADAIATAARARRPRKVGRGSDRSPHCSMDLMAPLEQTLK
ncbi:hypothetical protein [Shimia sp. MMG029]|uniref:hypothetical protein n=1 Tax=Shimia sp. MMG029 TaxID=3021978 RepID=UPI0022FDF7AF|nr:hypothetical protein [Shimia sp. MMG029]